MSDPTVTRERPHGWSLEQRLAVIALAFGAVAVFGQPSGGGPLGDGKVTINAEELALVVGREADHVTPEELADWVLQGRTDYRLLDLRDAAAYAEYHVPTAENVPIVDLPTYPLLRNTKIVLYSDGGIHAAQGWFLLRAAGFPGAYILLGGLDAWKDEVLFPTQPASPTPEQTVDFARRRAVSEYFGGTPRGAGEASETVATPALPPPPPPVAAATAAKPKRRKDGC